MEQVKRISRKRVYEIIQLGNDDDALNVAFDVVSISMVLLNLIIAIVDTFDISAELYSFLGGLELVTVVWFLFEYCLRIWTAEYLYPEITRKAATIRYARSFDGVVDLLSFLPYFLPFFFPTGVVAFRIFRIIRILRLFRINAYYDALNVISDVIKSKKDLLLSSIFIIFILMIASSLCMYSLEHEAQPDVFKNAFSGFWWSVSTLLTVGYGDIYPVTFMGRVFGVAITFLGVGMVAIPTGILSAGFVEQYTKLKDMNDYSYEQDIRFVHLRIAPGHPWAGKSVAQLSLAPGLLLTVIMRRGETMIPRGDTVIHEGDQIVIGAEAFREDKSIELKELVLKKDHPWTGRKIRELDISRRTMIVLVRRDGKPHIPNGNTLLMEGDSVLLYSRFFIPEMDEAKKVKI